MRPPAVWRRNADCQRRSAAKGAADESNRQVLTVSGIFIAEEFIAEEVETQRKWRRRGRGERFVDARAWRRPTAVVPTGVVAVALMSFRSEADIAALKSQAGK